MADWPEVAKDEPGRADSDRADGALAPPVLPQPPDGRTASRPGDGADGVVGRELLPHPEDDGGLDGVLPQPELFGAVGAVGVEPQPEERGGVDEFPQPDERVELPQPDERDLPPLENEDPLFRARAGVPLASTTTSSTTRTDHHLRFMPCDLLSGSRPANKSGRRPK